MLSINYYTDHVKVPNEWLRIGEDTGRKDERMSSMGKRLRKLRKEKGLTQTEVTGGDYSKEYVSQVELGKTKPSRKAMILFAKHLDVDESYFETGVDLAGRERYENLVAKGEASIERKEYAEAIRAFEEARTIAEKAENKDLLWRAEVGRGWALHFLGKVREALNLLTQARSYYGDQQDTAKLLNNLGDIKNHMREFTEAARYFQEGLGILRTVDDPETRSYLLNGLATAMLGEKQPEKSLELSSKSLAIMEGREGAQSLTGSSHMVRARAYLATGKLEEARAEVDEAREIFTSLEAPHFLSAALLLEGDILAEAGMTTEAGQAYRRSSELLQVVG